MSNTQQLLGYKGKVKATVIKNGVKVGSVSGHNKGEYNLFRFICDCLKGDYDSRFRPFYIKSDHVKNPTTDNPAFDSPETPITQYVVQDINNIPTTIFQANLKYVNTKDGKVNVLGLYSYNKRKMATINIDEIEIENDSSYTIIVQWYLSIVNVEEQTTPQNPQEGN